MSVVGIMGGSFNPVHCGHLMLASYIRQCTNLVDEVWLTLSPASPLKSEREMASDSHRLRMLQLALSDAPDGVRACDIELSMPRPSYTINTLREFRARYPQHQFRLIIGADNWNIFHKWYKSDDIIREFGVLVYPRRGYDIDPASLLAGVTLIDAPIIEVSSTFIRRCIAEGKNVNWFVPSAVNNYIKTEQLYK